MRTPPLPVQVSLFPRLEPSMPSVSLMRGSKFGRRRRTSWCIAISEDDKYLAVTMSNADAQIIDLQCGQPYATLRCAPEYLSDSQQPAATPTTPTNLTKSADHGSVSCVSFGSDGRHVVIGTVNHVELWDLDRRAQVHKVKVPNRPWIGRVACPPQNDLVVWLGISRFGVLDVISGEPVFDHCPVDRRWHTAFAWATDGGQLLTSNRDGIVRVWDVSFARSSKTVNLVTEINMSHRITSLLR